MGSAYDLGGIVMDAARIERIKAMVIEQERIERLCAAAATFEANLPHDVRVHTACKEGIEGLEWETMVFGGEWDTFAEHTSQTWPMSHVGWAQHNRIVDALLSGSLDQYQRYHN